MCLSLESRQRLADCRADLERDEAVLHGWIRHPETAPDPEAWAVGSMTDEDRARLRAHAADTDPLTRKQ